MQTMAMDTMPDLPLDPLHARRFRIASLSLRFTGGAKDFPLPDIVDGPQGTEGSPATRTSDICKCGIRRSPLPSYETSKSDSVAMHGCTPCGQMTCQPVASTRDTVQLRGRHRAQA